MILHRTVEGSVAVLELDYPGRSANVVDKDLLRELASCVHEALNDPAVAALVLTSGKSSFGAGADVAWLPQLAAQDDAEQFLRWVHDLMLALVDSDKPLIAAVPGYAFGGALELALGSDAILATPQARFGLPEVRLGLLPGGGGTQLLSRFVPLSTAAEMLTSGRTVDAAEAIEIGLVEEIVAPDRLLARAVELAEEFATHGKSRGRARTDSVDALASRRTELEKSPAGLSRAAATILDVLEAGAKGGFHEGLAAERAGFINLVRSAEARAAIHLFLLERQASSRADGGEGLERVAVVGGGQMGAGIAATAVIKGMHATVRDITQESVDRARAYAQAAQARLGIDQETARSRWAGTVGWDGFPEAQLVVEAVFEEPQLKVDVLMDLSQHVGEQAILATNTSAISIERLAGAVEAPERFLGMHFFSPVERMPLVELIPHSRTAPHTVARAAAAGRQLGKVAITVGDAPGFFTSRVYARWLVEGVRLVLDGVEPAIVDAAAKEAGFAIGPLQAHDEATLPLVLAASIGQVADHVMRERLDVDKVRGALERLVALGAAGRRHGRGFYEYDQATGRRTSINKDVHTLLGASVATPPDRQVAGRRLLLAFVTECLLCWDDGTLCHPSDGDLAAVLGIGFPRVLGGPFHWVDETGPARVVAMCQDLGTTAFPVGERLVALVHSGRLMSDEPRRPKPFEPIPPTSVV